MSDLRSKLPSYTSTIVPEYQGYQLIGDNQLVRFSESLLSIKCTKLDGLKFSGLCVRDQRIIDLLRRIHVGLSDVSDKVVLMIGTNDLLCGTSFEAMCEDFKELLKLLSKGTQKIILLTVPPVPMLEKNEDHWNRLKNFNEFIRQCRDDEKIFVGDAYAQFVVSKESPNKELCASESNVATNYSSCPTSIPIRFSKCLSIGLANRGLVRGRVSAPSNVNGFYPPAKRVCRTSLLPPDPKGTSTRKTVRRPYDSRSYDLDCQPPAARKPCCRPTGSEFPWWSTRWTPLVCNAIKDIINSVPQTVLFGGQQDSSATPSNRAISPERKDNSRFVSSSFVGDGSFPSKRAPVFKRKYKSSPPKRPNGCDSFETSSKRAPQENKFRLPPTPSSGSDDAFATTSSRVLSSQEKCNSFNSRLPSGSRHSSTAPFGRALTSERKYNLPYSLTTPSSGDDDSYPAPSRKASLPKGRSSFFIPAMSSSGGDDLFVAPSKNAFTSQGKCDLLFPTKPFFGDEDSTAYASKKVLPSETKCNSYSKADDNIADHDVENADKIRAECFEKYSPGDCRRPDLIHLNMRGLCALRGIIQGIIDIIDENYS